MPPATLTYRPADSVTAQLLTSRRFAAALLHTGRPTITVDVAGAVLRFSADTAEMMLRARLGELLEDALGPAWRDRLQPVDTSPRRAAG
jgi:hypothetical protein